MANMNGLTNIPSLNEYARDIYSWVLVSPDGKTDLDIGPAHAQDLMNCFYAEAFLSGPAIKNLARRNIFAGGEYISICDCTLQKRRDRGPGYFVEVCGVRPLNDIGEYIRKGQTDLEAELRREQELKKQKKAQAN